MYKLSWIWQEIPAWVMRGSESIEEIHVPNPLHLPCILSLAFMVALTLLG